MQSLVVITGPIGAGKSTVATLVGRRLGRAGRDVVVVDVDDVVFMQHVRGLDADTYWSRGVGMHARLVAEWFRIGVDTVVAHGPLVAPGVRGYDLGPLLQAVPRKAVVSYALLRAPVDVALERVRNDPERGEGAISKDETFLRGTHVGFADALTTAPAPIFRWDVDTTATTPHEIADLLAHELLEQ